MKLRRAASLSLTGGLNTHLRQRMPAGGAHHRA